MCCVCMVCVRVCSCVCCVCVHACACVYVGVLCVWCVCASVYVACVCMYGVCACVCQPQPDHWGAAQLLVVATWPALYGSYPVLTLPLCGPPLSMVGLLIRWKDIYSSESCIFCLGTSVLCEQQSLPPLHTSSLALFSHECNLLRSNYRLFVRYQFKT